MLDAVGCCWMLWVISWPQRVVKLWKCILRLTGSLGLWHPSGIGKLGPTLSLCGTLLGSWSFPSVVRVLLSTRELAHTVMKEYETTTNMMIMIYLYKTNPIRSTIIMVSRIKSKAKAKQIGWGLKATLFCLCPGWTRIFWLAGIYQFARFPWQKPSTRTNTTSKVVGV